MNLLAAKVTAIATVTVKYHERSKFLIVVLKIAMSGEFSGRLKEALIIKKNPCLIECLQ